MQEARIKILKQVEYESARRKRHINEKQEKEMRKAPPFFLCTFIFFYFVEKLKGTQGN